MASSDQQFDNPFFASRTRPGAIPFQFPAGSSAAALADRLAALGWRGQIVGPHGSGKSTLLVALAPAIEALGRTVMHFTLRDRQRSLDWGRFRDRSVGRRAVAMIDGYEQLSVWSRLRLDWIGWRRGIGLVITTHRPTSLPTLATLEVTDELAAHVVHALLPPGDATISDADAARALDQSHGNLREALFLLYDLYERRRRAGVR